MYYPFPRLVIDYIKNCMLKLQFIANISNMDISRKKYLLHTAEKVTKYFGVFVYLLKMFNPV